MQVKGINIFRLSGIHFVEWNNEQMKEKVLPSTMARTSFLNSLLPVSFLPGLSPQPRQGHLITSYPHLKPVLQGLQDKTPSSRLMFCSFHPMVILMRNRLSNSLFPSENPAVPQKCFRIADFSKKVTLMVASIQYCSNSWSPGNLQDSFVRNYICKGSLYFVQTI